MIVHLMLKCPVCRHQLMARRVPSCHCRVQQPQSCAGAGCLPAQACLQGRKTPALGRPDAEVVLVQAALSQQRKELEAVTARHLQFIDRLLADKDRLAAKCTQMAADGQVSACSGQSFLPCRSLPGAVGCSPQEGLSSQMRIGQVNWQPSASRWLLGVHLEAGCGGLSAQAVQLQEPRLTWLQHHPDSGASWPDIRQNSMP